MPKAYLRVALAKASTLSEPVVKTLKGGEGLPKMFCLVVSDLGHLRGQRSITHGSSLQCACGGVEEIGVGFQQPSVAGLNACKKNRIRMIVNGFALFRPGKPVIDIHCPQICWWWTCECSTGEGPRECVGNGPRRVAGGCCGYFGLGVCELVIRDSFVDWYQQEDFWARSSVER